MKKIIKLFVLTLFAFLFVNTVYADLSCSFTDFTEKINPADFDVTMPVCSKKIRDGFIEVGRRGDYSTAYNLGLEVVDEYYETESADGKDMVSGYARIPICNDTGRQVKAYSTCTATKSKSYHTCSYYSATYCPSGCSVVDGACTGTQRFYYCSGDAWSSKDGHCEASYTINDVVTSNVNAVSKCKSALGADSCSCSTVEYALECPAYRCERENKKVSACTPEFTLNGDYAYCVNPGQHFGGQYKEDTSFDVRNCANSYVSTDCGYANILIEGAFHHECGDPTKPTDNDAVNLALRLWSYHNGQRGFEEIGKTGIANRTGATCDQSIYFMKEEGKSHRPNVYANTYNYIMVSQKNNYFLKAQQIMKTHNYLPSYIASEGAETSTSCFRGTTFDQIACNGTVGVTCGTSSTYVKAFELFFNTLLGNKYMQSHLDQLYEEDGHWATSTGANVTENDEEGWEYGVWVVVYYEEEEFENAFGDAEVIKCDESDPVYQEHKDKIEPYCKTIVTYYDPDGNQIDPDDDAKIDYCRKNVGCFKKTSLEAICSSADGGKRIFEIRVRDKKKPSSTSIRKLIPCGADSQTQIMYQYVTKPGDTGTETTETTESSYYTNYICGDSAKGLPCTNYNIRAEENNNCSAEENKSYKKMIADPSLACIIRMDNQSERKLYDFSDKFGVNTNFCRIYCSDRVEYTLAGRTTAESGRQFKYDVRSDAKSTKLKNSEYLFSSVVKETRSCVSEIFFNDLPRDVDWKKVYALTDADMDKLFGDKRDKPGTWEQLFLIMADKAKTERNRQENLNQMVYDLYNCNLYNLNMDATNLRDTYGIYKPGTYTKNPAWTNIQSSFSSLNTTNPYGLVENSTFKFSDTINYTGGAKVAEKTSNSLEGEILGRIGEAGYVVKAGLERKENGEVTSLVNFGTAANPKYVKYCKNRNTTSTCLLYDSEHEDYDYNTNFGDSRTGQYIDRAHGIEYTYPTNNYALFKAETEVGFYNKDRYQIFENTGDVTLIGTSDPDPNLLTLNDYTYPLDVYAYNICSNHECDVTQTITVSPFFRASGSSGDKFINAIQHNNKFTCQVSVYGTTSCPDGVCPGYSKLYRNIDPSAMFPNGVAAKSNWATEEGQKAITKIEGTAELLQTSDELVDYRIILDPTQIKAIKEYNSLPGNGKYSEEKIYCDSTNIVDGNNYEGCTSEFLEILRGHKTAKYGQTDLGTLVPEYSSGTSKYDTINGN